MSETGVMELKADRKAILGEPGTLLVSAREGDADAFDALMRLHERQVFGTAWRLLGTVEDAQDAAQEVFLRLYRHLHRVDPRRPLGAWLHRVTVNVCHDSGRRKSRERRRSVALDDAEAAAPLHDASVPDPAAAAARGEERRMVLEGLASLAEKERAALVLRDVEGLRTSEVADALGSSEVTVRTQICRARLKLKSFRDRFYQRTPR